MNTQKSVGPKPSTFQYTNSMKHFLKSCLLASCLIISCLIISCSKTDSKTDFKELIVGTWKGTGRDSAFTVTFKKNDTAIINYSASGGKVFQHRYEVVDNVIKMSDYPDGLVIHERNENEISFGKNTKKLEESIELIYSVDFKRISK